MTVKIKDYKQHKNPHLLEGEYVEVFYKDGVYRGFVKEGLFTMKLEKTNSIVCKKIENLLCKPLIIVPEPVRQLIERYYWIGSIAKDRTFIKEEEVNGKFSALKVLSYNTAITDSMEMCIEVIDRKNPDWLMSMNYIYRKYLLLKKDNPYEY